MLCKEEIQECNSDVMVENSGKECEETIVDEKFKATVTMS